VSDPTRAEPDFSVPSWVSPARRSGFNGSANYKTPIRIRCEKPGDGVIGVVMFTRSVSSRSRADSGQTVSIVLKVEAGQSAGEPLEPDSWVEIYMSSTDLKTFYEREHPKEGDTLSVLFGGGIASGFGLPRKSFAIGIERKVEETSEW
jgi:hypothetical protein